MENEHKTPTELIAEIDYEIHSLSINIKNAMDGISELHLKIDSLNKKRIQLAERRKNLLNYLNTEEDEKIKS